MRKSKNVMISLKIQRFRSFDNIGTEIAITNKI